MRYFRLLIKIFWNSMAVFGVISLFAGAYAAYRIMGSYELTPHQFAIKVARKFGINNPQVEEALAPSPRYVGRAFQGKLISGHPRIFFRGDAPVERLRRRYTSDEGFRKKVDSMTGRKGTIWRAVAWACGTHREAGKKAIESLVRSELTLPKAQGAYGNGMEIAIAYDLLWDHPAWTTEMRQRVNILLRRSLQESLVVLDGRSASLWHGRFQLACSAWVVASALDANWEEDNDLLSRVQTHFLDAVSALSLSGDGLRGIITGLTIALFPLFWLVSLI